MAPIPVCTPGEVIRALSQMGFQLAHSTSSHRFFTHRSRIGLVTVPFHHKNLKRATLAGILDEAGLSTDKFLTLL